MGDQLKECLCGSPMNSEVCSQSCGPWILRNPWDLLSTPMRWKLFSSQEDVCFHRVLSFTPMGLHPEPPSISVPLNPHILTVNKDDLDEALKLNFIKPWLWVHIFLIVCVEKGDEHVRDVGCHRMWWLLLRRAMVRPAEWCLRNTSLAQENNQHVTVRFGHEAGIFLKRSCHCKGNSALCFAHSHLIQACEGKQGCWKNCILPCELGNF